MKLQQPSHDSYDLKYHTLSSTTEIDTTLNQISDELEHAVDNDKLLANPEFAIFNLPKNESFSKITEETQRDLSYAMQVADYSVYNEQVKCEALSTVCHTKQ